MVKRSIVLLLCTIGFPSPAFAGKYVITSVRFEDVNKRDALRVRFTKPLPAEHYVVCASGSTCPWLVIVVSRDETVTTIAVKTSTIPVASGSLGFSTDHEVVLELSQPISLEFTRVTVTFLGGDAPSQSLTVSDNSPTKPIVATDKADDATISFSGIVAPAVQADTTYTIDSKGSWVFRRLGKDQSPLFINGTAKSDKRPQADLDSFTVGGTVVDYAHAVIYRWDFASAEFNRKAQVANLVSAFRVIMPLSKTWFGISEGKPTLRAVTAVDVAVGVETGLNVKDELVERDSKFLLRGVVSASGFVAIPAPWVKKVTLSGEITGRYLGRDELFLETRGLAPKADPIPSLDRRKRVYSKAAVKLMLSQWVGLQLAYERGCVPPSFKFVDSSGTIGLVFLAKQPDARR